MTRPHRTSIHMATAFLWSLRSVDPRMQVGCVITNEDMDQVLSIGYNGPAKGLPDSFVKTDPGNSMCLHAEDNAIAKLREQGHTVFVTHDPCVMCAQRLVNAGIKRVIWAIKYRLSQGLEVLERCNVSVYQVNETEQQELLELLPGSLALRTQEEISSRST